MHMKHVLILMLAVFLTSCAVGPDYKRTATQISADQPFLNDLGEDNVEVYAISRWWERIDDPLLTSYVNELLDENLSLKQASERVIQAQERVNIEAGSFFPTLGAGVDASRSFSSFNNGIGALGGRNYVISYTADLNTSWQVDLFGRIRRSVESADAAFQASIYDQQALTHSLIAELLNRRVAIAVNQRRLELARQNATNRKKTYDLVDNRYNLGVSGSSAVDVFLAEENFQSVQSDVHEFERLLANEIYSLDVLLGQLPGTTSPTSSEFPLLPPPLQKPICLPADLIDRRPDLRASELRLAASTADVGVAVADLYPGLSLGGNIGFTGNDLDNLFSADQLAGSLLGSITSRLFEGGRLRANIRLRESVAREQAALYADNILNAVREVESALKAERELEQELISLEKSVVALKKAEEISRERYLQGILSLQNFLDTQQRRYNIEQSLLGVQQQKWNARISLYLALGGDWFDKNGYAPLDKKSYCGNITVDAKGGVNLHE